jgi:hypothetical protein
LAIAPDLDTEIDQVAFDTVPKFEQDVRMVRSQLVEFGRADTQVWVTSSQVNSDTPNPDGVSNLELNKHCTALTFQADPRGTDAFFAAWRPYLFSRLGKAGNQELFQWQYTAGNCPDAAAGCSTLLSSDTDHQNAEVDYTSGQRYRSYWVDQSLGHYFPPGANILNVDVRSPDGGVSNEIEVLATRRSDSGVDTVVVMVVNHAVKNRSADQDGPGARRDVVVDLNALPKGSVSAGGAAAWSTFESVRIDGCTDDGGAEPITSRVPPQSLQAGWIQIPFCGYGVEFVKMTRPAGP